VEPGDVLVVDVNLQDTYRRSGGSYEQSVAGVVSTNPTIIVGNGKTEYTAVMAMVGRVPVKASAENGSINRGDLLVTASTTGYAMKYDANKDNDLKMVGVIGVALEPLNEGSGKIMALIRTGWVYNRNESIANLKQNVQTIAAIQGIDLNNAVTTTLSVENTGGQLVYTGGNLDLTGNSLLNVATIQGKNNAWSIDEKGQFITRLTTANGTKEMFAMQSPTSEFVFSSSSQLSGGETVVVFDEQTQEIIDFGQPLKITVTLTSGEAKGIYVSEKRNTGFVVKELEQGASNATFDWMVVAKRKEAVDVVENVESDSGSQEVVGGGSAVESDPLASESPTDELETPLDIEPVDEVPADSEIVSEEPPAERAPEPAVESEPSADPVPTSEPAPSAEPAPVAESAPAETPDPIPAAETAVSESAPAV
ncbi:hypothetical protein KKA13_03335, partial [Patescibacteria group bacterium]|nr:hypothetical protein [Patescibacteria group bacterium]